MPSDRENDHYGRRFFVRQGVRDADQIPGRHAGVLRVSAVYMHADETPLGTSVLEALLTELTTATAHYLAVNDTVATSKSGDRSAGLHHIAGRIGAKNVRHGNRPGGAPGAHIDVERAID